MIEPTTFHGTDVGRGMHSDRRDAMIKINWGDFFVRRVILGLHTVKYGHGIPLGSHGPLLVGRDGKTIYQLRFWPPWKKTSSLNHLILPWYGCWDWRTVKRKYDQD